MGPPKFGAPGNCPICPPLKPALNIPIGILHTYYSMYYNIYYNIYIIHIPHICDISTYIYIYI